MLTLGIETSCDETAVAILENARTVRSSIISSQITLHERYGGVVPELASRAHVDNINIILQEAIKEAACDWHDLNLVAVTNGPGLVGALMVGVAAAKGIALSLSIPLVGVHHIYAHIYANWLAFDNIVFPCIALIVSGGHTTLLFMESHKEWKLLGATIDDACGEAFDKVARHLGLSYPGGPIIDALSEKGDPSAFKFPRALLGDESLNFSFSGLKTAVAREASLFNQDKLQESIADFAASFQEAAVDMLVEKIRRAVLKTKTGRILLAGGVAANRRLRYKLEQLKEYGAVESIYIPPPSLCTDNAAMVACAGYNEYKNGCQDTLTLDVKPMWEMDE